MTASGDRRRAEQAAMRARAAEIGQQYELGEPVTQLLREHTPLRQHWGCMTMFFSVLLPLFLLPLLFAVHVPPAAIIPIMAAGFAIGVAVYASQGPPRPDWVLSYTGGLAHLVGGEQAPRVIPWGMVDTAVHRFVVPTYRDNDPYLSELRVTSLDGTEITVGDEYPQAGREQIGDQVDMMLARTRLEAAVDQVLSGLPAQFGTVVVSPGGIRWQDGRGRDRELAWRDLSSVGVERWGIRLNRPGWKSVQDVRMTGVPDSYVALLLVQDLAGRVPFRLDGDRLALPGPAPDEAELAPRPLLLTEQDVSEILGRPVRALGGPARLSFRGQGVTITLMVMGTGRIGQLNLNAGRKRGRPVGGLGREAWLVSSDRSLVVGLPAATFKVIANGLPEASRGAALVPLARIVADRIAQPEPELR
jgi:hypothetical protein